MSNFIRFDADGKPVFPYATWEAGQQDKWAKLGGVAGAFEFLVHGVMQKGYHKKSQGKRNAEQKEAMAFYKAHQEKNGTKSERELGRKP